MAINFPTSIDSLTNPISSNTLDNPSHAGQHSDANDAIEALETKVGVNSSAVSGSIDYKLTNTSSSNPGHKHTLANGATDVTASAAELNQLDDVSVGGTSSGDVVTIDGTQILTNKTINGDNNTITNLAHGSEVDNPSSGVHGITGNVVGTTDTQTLTNKTLTNPKLNEDVAVTIKASELNGLLTGWIPAGETWTYASATTITVPSGAASKYQKGDKIKLTQTTVKYFYVVSVADTVLTVTGGSDYTVANAAITLPYFSKVENPQGFPGYFNCTLTASVSSGTLTTCTSIGRFSVDGSWVTLNGKITLTDKGTGSGVLRSTVPISAAGTISCVGFGRESGVSGADVQIYLTTTLIIFYGMVITNGYETQYCIRYLYT